ncbi:hypothetical protein OIU77_012495 [Salix suchowensis]|uniref:Uncharacterized protein n=1 Tax=Salix suchowensis TaxID=1278906 RepID=A0ABQ9A4G7_9ROSI|nr:hypothetical protein OIU77_012495 [Salix suchowensis]
MHAEPTFAVPYYTIHTMMFMIDVLTLDATNFIAAASLALNGSFCVATGYPVDIIHVEDPFSLLRCYRTL